MKKKLLFRADGNSETGLGHLYRLFALVEMYKNDYECVFVTKSSSTIKVIPEEYTIMLLPNEIDINEESNWLAGKFCPKEYMIIADGYHFATTYQKKIKEVGFNLMYIDDLANDHMYADIVVNHSPKITVNDYSSEKHTQFALGTDYAILRPIFLNAARKQKNATKIDTAFVCFGGADKNDLTLKTVKALTRINNIREINIVLGGAYTHKEIYKLHKKNSTLKIYTDLNEEKLFNVMNRCNFGIVPSSTILYELCAVKMAILSGYFVDNQKLIYEGFLSKSAIFGVGNFLNYTVETFHTKINEIINIENYQKQCFAQKKLISVNIKINFINLLKNQLC